METQHILDSAEAHTSGAEAWVGLLAILKSLNSKNGKFAAAKARKSIEMAKRQLARLPSQGEDGGSAVASVWVISMHAERCRAHLRGATHIALCGYFPGGWLSGSPAKGWARCRRCLAALRAAPSLQTP
jgi:hypothetical protein